MIASPHTSSAIHHHGPEDTIVYAVQGRGSIVSDGGQTTQVLEPGDWALIPAYAEHQEVNEGEGEVVSFEFLFGFLVVAFRVKRGRRGEERREGEDRSDVKAEAGAEANEGRYLGVDDHEGREGAGGGEFGGLGEEMNGIRRIT